MNVAYPYSFDNRGRTASADDDRHLRDLVEQVLFTSPGERVMRPSFGSGILEMVFAPADDTLASAVQASVQAALQQWLGDRIRVGSVRVDFAGSALRVEVVYAPLRSNESRTASFVKSL